MARSAVASVSTSGRVGDDEAGRLRRRRGRCCSRRRRSSRRCATRRPAVAIMRGVEGIGDRAEQPVGLPHRRAPSSRRARSGASSGFSAASKCGGEPRLDGVGQLAGDDDRGAAPSSAAARAERHLAVGRDQHHGAGGVGEAEGQHLGAERADLAGREVDDGEHLPADERRRVVVHGDLRRGPALAELGAEVDPELQRRLARLGERLGAGDAADADVDLEEVVEADRRPCGAPVAGGPREAARPGAGKRFCGARLSRGPCSPCRAARPGSP